MISDLKLSDLLKEADSARVEDVGRYVFNMAIEYDNLMSAVKAWFLSQGWHVARFEDKRGEHWLAQRAIEPAQGVNLPKFDSLSDLIDHVIEIDERPPEDWQDISHLSRRAKT